MLYFMLYILFYVVFAMFHVEHSLLISALSLKDLLSFYLVSLTEIICFWFGFLRPLQYRNKGARKAQK